MGQPAAEHRSLLLLDTASLYFRAFFGVPDRFHAPDGTPVNAVRGMLDFLTRLATDRRPGLVVAAWDNDWRPQFRTALVPSYKAHRVSDPATNEEEAPDGLQVQVPLIRALLPLLGVPVVGCDGYEADDVIGTLSAHGCGPVEIVTGDRDLFQLVDPRTVVLYTARGVGRLEEVDDTWLMSKYGVHGYQYADFATMRGDASDGLPGVKGVGEKTAASLLARYGDLDSIRRAAADPTSDLTPAVRKAIGGAAEYLDVAPAVVAVRRDLPLPVPEARPDRQAAMALAGGLGLASAAGRALAALS